MRMLICLLCLALALCACPARAQDMFINGCIAPEDIISPPSAMAG